ncbi:alpha/beta hydrolase [Solitalea koreensis]|uniref:Acetyl esterase/lipase n=1 Tax=Solitalea koreensis TaxID=543615 RepID=A0A521CBN5_9SPHI|nr:alpha/beta hydrolase [Solitalea koreensis]SMO56221.1 Acetyl esterase/lipase [Solitalea koreensis]
MKAYLRLPFLTFLVISLASCSRIGRQDVKPELPIQQLDNIAYGADPEQKFDLMLPQERNTNTKVLIFLHGGSWRKGDKSDYRPILRYFVERGFAVVNMNYRLAEKNKNKFPAQIDDISAVINYITSRSHELGISTNNIGLAGHSAGAHLALLYSYEYNTLKKIKAVAALAPPSDFVLAGHSKIKSYQEPIYNFLGKAFLQDSTLWIKASPYWQVSTTSVPTILFHGSEDKVVPFLQSQRLEERLTQMKVPSKFITYDAGHVWLGSDLTDTRENVVTWFNTYLK